jgi:hypothetical protein
VSPAPLTSSTPSPSFTSLSAMLKSNRHRYDHL